MSESDQGTDRHKNKKDSTSIERLTRAELRARKVDRDDFKALPRTPIVIVLDGVEGNYNKGAIFRLCDAFMLEHLHLCGDSELEYWHRRFTKAARGTRKWVPYTVGEEVTSVIEAYRARGYQIAVAEQCEGSVPIWDASLSAPLCLVLGGELTGVSSAALAEADERVELPTLGMANSLNVSMSAGMLVSAAYQRWRSVNTL